LKNANQIALNGVPCKVRGANCETSSSKALICQTQKFCCRLYSWHPQIHRTRKVSKPQPDAQMHSPLLLRSYYIGFNSWSSSILGLSQESLTFNQSTQMFSCTYLCRLDSLHLLLFWSEFAFRWPAQKNVWKQ
jgi:hypothetical protein